MWSGQKDFIVGKIKQQNFCSCMGWSLQITNGKMKYPQNTQLACPTGYLLNAQKRQEAEDEKGSGLLLEAKG